MPEREHDIVLFGATGFTGALTAEYLAQNAPEGLRWALAGRNRAKLDALSERLGIDVPLLHADVGDEASLRSIAESARVVITTVGPYVAYGEPLVAACAAAGTDYVDLTGEPEFVDRMYCRYHDEASKSGARIVHACGFDSIPHDLGVLYTVQQLPEGVPLNVRGFVRAGGRPSGGTFHSAMTAFSRVRETQQAHKERRQTERPENGRSVRLEAKPHRELGYWAVPMPTIDPQVIARSARALDRYGPEFSYGHYAGVKRLPIAVGGVAGAASLFVAAQIPPVRKALLGRLSPGDGPSESERAKSWFKVRFVGEGGGERVVTMVSGGDPGYGETSKMLAESALCLAQDDLPETSGQLTPAVAMGDKLIARLQRAGIGFEVLES